MIFWAWAVLACHAGREICFVGRPRSAGEGGGISGSSRGPHLGAIDLTLDDPFWQAVVVVIT